LFEGQDDADRPSVTTHATNKRSIVYYTSDWKHVFRKYYNGSTWSHLLVASNATHPNISAGTSTAKYIWLSGSTSPYEIKLSTETLPLDGLAKLASTGTDAAEVVESESIYHRSAVLQDKSLATLLWVEFGEVVLKNANDPVRPVEFVPIDESRFEPTQENVLGYLETLPFYIGKDATVLQWEQNLYGRGLSPLAAVESQDMVIDFQLVEATTGKVLATLAQDNFTGTAAETRFQGAESRDVSAYAGRKVKLRVVASGLKSNAEGITTGVVEVHLDPSRGAAKGNQDPFKSVADISLPQSFELSQNWPNPFNSTTVIYYALPKAAHVSLQLFNVRGQLIRVLVNSHKSAGRYQAVWDGKDDSGRVVASGVYIYRLHAGEDSEVKKMALLK